MHALRFPLTRRWNPTAHVPQTVMHGPCALTVAWCRLRAHPGRKGVSCSGAAGARFGLGIVREIGRACAREAAIVKRGA